MIGKIKQWIVDYRIANMLKKKKHPAYVSLNTCKKVLVVYDIETITEIAFYNSFINDLINRGKEVKAVAFFHEKHRERKEDLIQEQTIFFTSKELTKLKLPPASLLKEVSTFNEDLLIDLSMESINCLRYLSASSMAPMKAGMKLENKYWMNFQIAIDNTKDVKFLSDMIIHYLASIK